MQLLIHDDGNESFSETVLMFVLSCKCEEALFLLVFGCYFCLIFSMNYKHKEI